MHAVQDTPDRSVASSSRDGHEPPVFAAPDGRRARRLRLAGRLAAGLTALWLAALLAGALGVGGMPGLPPLGGDASGGAAGPPTGARSGAAGRQGGARFGFLTASGQGGAAAGLELPRWDGSHLAAPGRQAEPTATRRATPSTPPSSLPTSTSSPVAGASPGSPRATPGPVAAGPPSGRSSAGAAPGANAHPKGAGTHR